MNLTGISLLLFGAALILGYQNSFDVLQERVDREYVDNSLLDFTCGTYKSNRTTNALNLTTKLKHPLADNDTVFVTGYKWLSNEYRLDIIQFGDTIKNIMNISYFDLNRLFHNYTTPQFVWPLKPQVTYQMSNWIPDSTQFPPGVPEGRWKLLVNVTKANRTPIVAFSWYFKIGYKVKIFENIEPRSTRRPRKY